jgi:hypothetical protein
MDVNSEIDRLLDAQAGRVNAVTTRSAGLTAAAALAASVVSAQLTIKVKVGWWVIISLGLATLAGVLVLLGGRLEDGPDGYKMLEWERIYPDQVADLICMAKVIAARANEGRVRFVDVTFYIQAVLVGAAVITALISVGSW